jgi:hypothetical protein
MLSILFSNHWNIRGYLWSYFWSSTSINLWKHLNTIYKIRQLNEWIFKTIEIANYDFNLSLPIEENEQNANWTSFVSLLVKVIITLIRWWSFRIEFWILLRYRCSQSDSLHSGGYFIIYRVVNKSPYNPVASSQVTVLKKWKVERMNR